MQPHWAINFAYLFASVLFILGIKGLTHPRTAVRGNMMSALGMLIAVIAASCQVELSWGWVVAGLVLGGGIGAVWATKVQMTAMPQMVAIFNGFGGGASVFVAGAELVRTATGVSADGAEPVASAGFSAVALVSIAAAGLIGAVTFSGSFIAFAKLQEFKAFRKPFVLPAHQSINAGLMVLCIVMGGLLIIKPELSWAYWLLVVVALGAGITLVSPIGGADMPVVVALLNSYSGLAAAAAGFAIENNVLIITGSLVGASGLILTSIMCKAMNRSLGNVIFGKIDVSGVTTSADEIYEGKIKATSADEIAMLLDGVQRVVIVPGYGMAVAQAQHAVRDLYNQLTERDINVEFAVHPVAGRMPGHMNVLLAEVDIPYDKLREMDSINPEFSQVDVAIVLGANDVVNPDARKGDSPIAGMPILNVDEARTVVVIKRSLSPGFAGIPNPLFAADNALMYFADGKKAVQDIVAAVKEV